MKILLTLITNEPVAVIAVVVCVLALLADYGLPVSGQHADDIKNLIAALLVIIGAVVARSQVVPIAKLNNPPAPQ